MRASTIRFAAVFQALLLVVTLLIPALAAATEITTDLWVYQHGDTVTVTGVDFGQNELVDFVTTDPLGAVVDTGSATTDDVGGVAYAFVLNVTVPGIYDVVATGQTSGYTASTQFDPPNLGFTLDNPSPSSVAYSDIVTFSGTFTCANAGGGAGNQCPTTSVTQTATVAIRTSGSFVDVATATFTFAFTSSSGGCPTTCSVPWSMTWQSGRNLAAGNTPPGTYDVRLMSSIAGGNVTLPAALVISREDSSTASTGPTSGTAGTSLALSATVADLDGGSGVGNGVFSPDANLAGANVVSFQLFNAANTVAVSGVVNASINSSGATTGSPSLMLPAAGTYTLRTNYATNTFYSASSDTDTITSVAADSSAPVITKTVTGTLGDNGWYTSDVAVDWTVTDPETSFTTTGCVDSTLTAETTGTTLSCSATSAGGTSSDSVTIKLDKTGPSANLTVSAGTPGANGWYTSNVTVDTSGSDSISSPVACTADQFQTDETTGQLFSGSCTNDAGLTTNAVDLTVKLDKTGPSASLAVSVGTLGDNGWYVSEVTVSTTGTDSISNPTVCTGDQLQTTDTAGTTFNGSCTNDAGLTTNATALEVKRDATAPTVTVTPDRIPDAPPWYNAAVIFDTSGTDGTSGVLDADCTANNTYTGPDGTGFTVGGSCTDQAGNVGTGTSDAFDFDDTNPVIAFASRVPLPNIFGWANVDVLVTWTCTDVTSGPVDTSVSNLETTEGENQSSTETCHDVAGNTSSDTQVGISIDKTDPGITFDGQTPAENANGWNNSPVTLDWSCTDGLSGPVDAALQAKLSSEGENQTSTATCYDEADNDASDTQVDIDIDLTDPIIAFDTRTAANANGWNNTAVTVTWTCFDALSGAEAASISVVISSEGADQEATGTCTDLAGNTASDTVDEISIDTTDPGIALASRLPAANVHGWNNSAVTVTWTCSDGLSGPASPSVADTKSAEGAAQTASSTCFDLAGNSAGASLGGINIDLSAPTAVAFGAHGLTEGASYDFGFVPAGPTTCSATYDISGEVGCVVTGYSTAVGAHTVQAAATDKAGNVGYASIHYTVLAWTITGFYQPVDMNGIVNSIKGGQTVPLKFEVFAGSTELTSVDFIDADFIVNTLSCTNLSGAPLDEIELTTTGGTSFRYDGTAGQFIQNWKTPAGAGKCYLVTVALADGSSRSALFKTK